VNREIILYKRPVWGGAQAGSHCERRFLAAGSNDDIRLLAMPRRKKIDAGG